MGKARGATVLGSENAHFWLVQRMAKAAGVDLVRAWEAGLIDNAEWSGIVTKCRGCQWSEGCTRFLDKPVTEERALPEPCLNRARLDAIRAKLEEASS